MLVNLTDIFTEEGKEVTKECPLELKEVSFGGDVFPVLSKSPVSLTLSNMGQGKALVNASVKVTVGLRCDRCLQEVKREFDLSFSVHVVTYEKATDEEREEEAGFLEGYQLNVDSLVDGEILTNWPMKVLCREDCKGLCSVCGKNLNTGSCDCDTFVPDPRMAAIKDIFQAKREV